MRRKATDFKTHLEEHKVSVKMYRGMFERYCEHLRICYEARRTLKKEGLTVENRFGEVKEHPATKIINTHSARASDIEKFFSQLLRGAAPEEGESALDKWLKGGKKPHVVKK